MLEILKYTIPALIVLLCTWLVMHKLFKSEEDKRLWELKRLSQKEISPIRMRAYERLALMLERTQPEHLLNDGLMDEAIAGIPVNQLQLKLLQKIRMEFDHNMSQQIYVSETLWQTIMEARNATSSFITVVAAQLPKGSSSLDYAKLLITAYNTNGETANEKALRLLNEEAKELL